MAEAGTIRTGLGLLVTGLLSSLALALLAISYSFGLVLLNVALIKNLSAAATSEIAMVAVLDAVCIPMVIASIRTTAHLFSMVSAMGNRPLPPHPFIVRWGPWLIICVWVVVAADMVVEKSGAGPMLLALLPIMLAGWTKFTIYRQMVSRG